ncbi:MAG: alpha/beta fold hydrolase, partial [Anaerolineae bacterium]
ALDRRARFSIISAAVATFLVAVPAAVLVLEADPIPAEPPPSPRPDTRYWELSTGSRIAYSAFRADDPLADRNPIVFLHNPDRAVLDTDIAFFRQFSEEGFSVYLYDLVGCGLSGRLDDITAYTIARHVEDLEAIRETIEADRLILIGHAGGSEIAARYMVAHRDRVQSAIFYSPTPLWSDEEYATDETRTAALSSGEPASILALPALGIRPIVAAAIAVHSPRTAQAYVPQEEMIAWANQTVNEGAMVCAGELESAPQPASPGYNPYVGIVTGVTANQTNDPRPLLSELLVPTILLRGECDPVDPAVVSQYQEAIPYLQVYYVEEAGSMLHLARPDAVKRTILTLLRKEREG